MNQRSERLAAQIQAVLGDIISRGEIRDSRVRDVGIVTVTWVRVTGDLSEAKVGFTVFGANEATLERVRRGLQAARSYLQQALGRRLRARKTALLTFEIDKSLDHAFRVDGLLREVAAAGPAAGVPAEGEAAGDGGDAAAEGEEGADAAASQDGREQSGDGTQIDDPASVK